MSTDMKLKDRIVRGIARLDAANKAAFAQNGAAFAQAALDREAALDGDGDDITAVTSFGPAPWVVFDVTVEMAFLVAAAEGQLSDDTRVVFQSVIAEACNYVVQDDKLEELLADLTEMLAEDGLEKRARMVSRALRRADHQREGLCIAALIAHLFGAISARRREALELLARAFGLDSTAVDQAIREAEQSLAGD